MDTAESDDTKPVLPEDLVQIGPYIYDLSKLLGEGVTGKVYKGYNKTTATIVAVKKINKSSIRKSHILKSILQEISNLKKIKHRNIMNLVEAVQSPNNIYLIMEYCNSGNLKSYLQKQIILEETEAKYLIMQIIEGLRELIAHKIIHRDIKPANILLQSEEGNLTCKIGDLGYSKVLSGNSPLETSIVGTPQYMDPKRLQNADYHGKKVDSFSVGVIMYEMMFGCPPWRGDTYYELSQNVSTQPLIFPTTRKLSREMKDFIEKALEKEENERISIDEMYYHPLFKRRFSLC